MFCEAKLLVLLRKISTEMVEKHYHSDEKHLIDFIRCFNTPLEIPGKIATSVLYLIYAD